MSPSTSPPNFPLGSQETEVKVAAGALGRVSLRAVGMSLMPPVLGLGCLPLQQVG